MLRYVLPLLLAVPLAAADNKVAWKGNYADALAEAKSSHKLILADFFSPT